MALIKFSTIEIFFIIFFAFIGICNAIWTKNLVDQEHRRQRSSAFVGSLADKYANVKMSRKDIINELQGLSRKAVELQRKWKLRSRTRNYTPQQILEESKKQPAPFVIPVNRHSPSMPETAAHKLAFLQLRDCIYIRSGCVSSTKMNTSQKSNYIDQLEAILGGKTFNNINNSPPTV